MYFTPPTAGNRPADAERCNLLSRPLRLGRVLSLVRSTAKGRTLAAGQPPAMPEPRGGQAKRARALWSLRGAVSSHRRAADRALARPPVLVRGVPAATPRAGQSCAPLSSASSSEGTPASPSRPWPRPLTPGRPPSTAGWWPSKADLAVDAFFQGTAEVLRLPESGSARDDFRQQIVKLAGLLRGPRGAAIAAMLEGARTDPVLARALRERWLGPGRAWGLTRMEQARAEGQLRPGVDPAAALHAPSARRARAKRGGHGPDPRPRLPRRVREVV